MDGAEGLVALIFWVVGLGVLLVFGLALWLGKGTKAKIIGFFVACVVCSPVLWPLAKAIRSGSHNDSLKREATAECLRESALHSGPFVVDGLVDETKGLSSEDIKTLLIDWRFPFVEIRLPISKVFRSNNDTKLVVPDGPGIAHIRLAKAAEAQCVVPSSYPEHFFAKNFPVVPSSCVEVRLVDKPTASHALELMPSPKGKEFLRVVLRNLQSGAVVAGFTDAGPGFDYEGYKDGYIPRPDFRHRQECRPNGTSAMPTLLWKVQPSPRALEESAKHLLRAEKLLISDIPHTLVDFAAWVDSKPRPTLRSSDGPSTGGKSATGYRVTWGEAYALAERQETAMGVYGQMVIRPSVGVAYQIEWGKASSGPHGEFFALGEELYFLHSAGAGGPTLVALNLRGEVQWVAKLADVTSGSGGSARRFEPRRFEFAPGTVMIHGWYGDTRRDWTVNLPLAELKRAKQEASAQ